MAKINHKRNISIKNITDLPKLSFFANYDQAAYPELILRGKWLNDLGFGKGKSVLILIEPNKITLTLQAG